jgi:transcriptional regulator with XRE-family HTH domain
VANLRELMARIGWSDAELARRVSVRPGAIRDWRTGRREAPPNLLEWLRMYAEAIERLPRLPKDWDPELRAEVPALFRSTRSPFRRYWEVEPWRTYDAQTLRIG